MSHDDEDSDQEILLEDQIQDRIFVKLRKFIRDKFNNIKQQNIEEIIYS